MMPLLPEPRSHTGCATCRTARCCVVFDPELTGSDLLRLTSLGLDPDDVAELRPTHASQAGPDAVFLGDDRAWDLRLRRTAGPTPHPAAAPAAAPTDPALDPRRCGLLITLGGGLGRCGVYDQRPLVCRLFPSDLTSLGVMVITPEAICPPGAFAQERADLPTLTHLHLLARHERAAFRGFLAAWRPLAERLRPTLTDAALRARFFEALLTFSRALDPLTPQSPHTGPACEPALASALGPLAAPGAD